MTYVGRLVKHSGCVQDVPLPTGPDQHPFVDKPIDTTILFVDKFTVMDNNTAAHAGLTKLLSASSHPVNNNNNQGSAGANAQSNTPPHVHAQPSQNSHYHTIDHQQSQQQQQQHHQGPPPPASYASYNQQGSYPYSFGQQAAAYRGPNTQQTYGMPPQQQQQHHSAYGPQYATGPPPPQQGYASQPHSPVYHHAPHPHQQHHPAMQPTNGPSSYNARYTQYGPGPGQHPLATGSTAQAGDIGTSTINDLIGATHPGQGMGLGSQYRPGDVTLPPPQPSSTNGQQNISTGLGSNGGTSGNVTDDENKAADWNTATTKTKAPKQRNPSSGKAPQEKKFSHIKSHMGVRDFACPECNKKFSRKHDCTRHCIAIHKYDKETGKKAGAAAAANSAGGNKRGQAPPQQQSVQVSADFVDNQPPPQAYATNAHHIPLPPNTLHA
ncbi:hypothetical protein OIO90_006115 [Microbotryomycetes sp. JL221]|nr:hypothetical protein OIO90_006115 [Microbotryomycetes sp. JL221]